MGKKANEEKCMSLYCGQGRDRGNFCWYGGGLNGEWRLGGGCSCIQRDEEM